VDTGLEPVLGYVVEESLAGVGIDPVPADEVSLGGAREPLGVDVPPEEFRAPPPIGVAVSGPQSCQLAGELADAMIAVEPSQELGDAFDAAGGAGKPRVGQVPLCFDRDREAAVARAHEQFRWFGGGFKVNAELPGPTAFDAATQFVRPEDVAEEIPCGDDVERAVEAVRPYVDAAFTHVALVQVGGDHQGEFIRWAEDELLPALRSV
jgi:G6PDH family F420-dependent oxidoreductase